MSGQFIPSVFFQVLFFRHYETETVLRHPKDCKTLSVNPAVNGYLYSNQKMIRHRKK